MHGVFGSTDIFIGLHARKIVTALDFFDWEESGTSVKSEVKMQSITGKHVKESLKTWMPKGEARFFPELMESLGMLLGADTCGTYGKVKKVINQRFSPADKKTLVIMVDCIIQFYTSLRA